MASKTEDIGEVKVNPKWTIRKGIEAKSPREVSIEGEIVAATQPESGIQNSPELLRILERHDELGSMISQSWPTDASAAEAVSEDRREL